jgi:hypothetical protein
VREGLESGSTDVKFFRFRAPTGLMIEGSTGAEWLFESAKYIDFTWEHLITEGIGITQLTFGGFSFKDLCEMTFDNYEMTIKKCKELQKRDSE